jgi:hypothetical protein
VDRNCRLSASVCGECCLACVSHDQCRGCAYQLGLTRYGECAVFQCCAADKGLEHCGLCPEFPCRVFLESAPEDRVRVRIEALRERAVKGTDEWLAEEEARRVSSAPGKKEGP